MSADILTFNGQTVLPIDGDRVRGRSASIDSYACPGPPASAASHG